MRPGAERATVGSYDDVTAGKYQCNSEIFRYVMSLLASLTSGRPVRAQLNTGIPRHAVTPLPLMRDPATCTALRPHDV